jgi:hypothetical protein
MTLIVVADPERRLRHSWESAGNDGRSGTMGGD